MAFERIGGEEVWEGRIAKVRVDRFRYDDGEEAEREIVDHPGAVAVIAHDGERIYLVRQPREAVDEQALLELPAGKVEDDGPLETGKRELAEEVHVYLATELEDADAEADESERIEVVTAPLAGLDDVIAECRDAKSLVGLLWFRAFNR